MGYLVYCPTCQGRMSNNASSCPHCGEVSFRVKTKTTKRVACSCNGRTTKMWNHISYVHYVNGKITLPKVMIKTGRRYTDNNGNDHDDCIIEISKNKTLLDCISKGDYELKDFDGFIGRSGDAHNRKLGNDQILPSELSFDAVRSRSRCNKMIYYGCKEERQCYYCNGTGYVYRDEYESKDIRKPVK